MRLPSLALIALAACARTEEDAVAKRDTGVAPARVTTETAAPAATDSAGVVASDTTATNMKARSEAVHIVPPAESLKVKP